MSIVNLIKRWSTSIDIETPSSAKSDQFNQYSYTEDSISGRLIQKEEEIILTNGEKTVTKAQLYTDEDLQLDTKVGVYKIIASKQLKDKYNDIQGYKYWLK